MNANVFVYAKLGLDLPYGLDLNWFRLGGVGLGNLLITWARAEILARTINGRLLAPTFNQLRLGPIRRGEKDWRTYLRVFRRHRDHIHDLHRLWIVMSSQRVPEDSIGKTSLGSRPVCVVVEGICGLFGPLAMERNFIRMRLNEIVAPGYRFPLDLREDVVGVHVRTGDFRSLGWDTSFSWFAAQVSSFCSKKRVRCVELFTDDATGEVYRLVLQAARGTPCDDLSRLPAITSIMRLASCKWIIGSHRSTFSMWSAFLGEGEVVFPNNSELINSGLAHKISLGEQSKD